MDELEYYIDSLFPNSNILVDNRTKKPIIETIINLDKYIEYFGELPIQYFLDVDLSIKLTLKTDHNKLQIIGMIDYTDKIAYYQELDDYFDISSTTDTALKINRMLNNVDVYYLS